MQEDPAIKVLLVEDDHDDFVITRDILRRAPRVRYELSWASGYDEALEAIARNEYDACLLDYRLGQRNGLDLLRQALEGGCQVPFILLTGQSEHDVDVAAMEAGAADYLLKERLSPSVLERSIRYAIERTHTARLLRQSQGLFSSFMNNLQGMASIKDAQGRYLYANRCLEESFRSDVRGWVGRTDAELLPAAYAQKVRERDLQVLAQGREVRQVERVPLEGEERCFLSTTFPIDNGCGEALVGCLALDITDRVRAEESQKRSESLLAQAERLARLESWEWRLESQRHFWSRGQFRIFGIGEEQSPGDQGLASGAVFELVHPEDREMVRRVIGEALECRGEFDFFHRVVRPDGQIRIVHQRGAVVDRAGHEPHVVGSTQDVTEQREAEEALKLSEVRFRSVVQSLDEALLITDLDDVVLYANGRIGDLTGYSPQEMMGRPAYELLPPHAWPAVREPNHQRESGASKRYEVRLRRKDGTLFWAQVHALPYRDAQGQVVGTTGAISDISAHKESEALLAARMRLESGLALCSRVLLTEPTGGQALEQAIAHLLAATGAGRVSLFENFEDEGGLSAGQTHEVCAPGAQAHFNSYFSSHARRFAYSGGMERWREALSQNRAIAGCPRTFPSSERAVLEPQGVRSLLALPVWVRGQWHGFIGFDDVRSEREWSEEEVQILRTASEMIGAFFERQKTEQELRRSEERYALAAAATNDGLWDWDMTRGSIYFSPRWKEMLGYAPRQIGNSPQDWLGRVHPDDRDALQEAIDSHVQGRTGHLECQYRVRHADGSFRWMLLRGLAVHSSSPSAPGAGASTCTPDTPGAVRMVGSQTDITEHKSQEENLRRNAFFDSLTGLPNRALFMDRLGQALEHGHRRPDYLFGVLFLDLDGFKTVNDSLGHMQGDELLVAASRRLQSCLRTGDTLARLGGDEFAILIDDIKDPSDATRLALRIQEAFRQPFVLEGHEVFTQASVGITFSGSGSPDAAGSLYSRPEEMLRDADTAMYRAKAAGKGCHQVFDSTMHEHVLMRLRLESSLRRAIEREEFLLHFQPIMELSSGQLQGFEALVRWRSPEHGMIPPNDFVPVAEETGLILPLSQWVLRQACLQMKAWQDEFPPCADLVMSVNLSSRQFLQPDLVASIAGVLEETGLDPKCLKLEITETVLIENAESAATLLRALRAMDIGISMDDFGTGYSSLAALHRFPIDTLKIDRSFITRLGPNGEQAEIVRAIIALAHSMEMDVTAEGVEAPFHSDQLRRLGCECAQGFLFSRPLDADSAAHLVASACENPHAQRLPLFGDASASPI
jgi:diguanylate cyclase (GGDEF)-like protein/PAS domain S-box-containing protein